MISSASGFKIGSADAIDERLVLTKVQMKAANDNVFPDVYLCVCKDDGYLYTYNKTNEVDATIGKFRLFKSGSDDTEFEAKLKEFTQNNVEGNKDLPVSDTAIKNLMAAPDGIATLDSTGKLAASQLPTSAREIVGYLDASVDHTLPDEADYDNGNEIIITANGYIVQSTAFTLKAGNTLTNLEVNQANQLIGYGYVFTLDGLGTVESFATNKVNMTDGSEIALPYASDLSATSTPATVQVPVKEGDSMMLIDGHWIHLSSSSGVESVNGKTGVVTLDIPEMSEIEEKIEKVIPKFSSYTQIGQDKDFRGLFMYTGDEYSWTYEIIGSTQENPLYNTLKLKTNYYYAVIDIGERGSSYGSIYTLYNIVEVASEKKDVIGNFSDYSADYDFGNVNSIINFIKNESIKFLYVSSISDLFPGNGLLILLSARTYKATLYSSITYITDQLFIDKNGIVYSKSYSDTSPDISAVDWVRAVVVTGVKGNSETEYRTGQVNITKANIGLGNVENTADMAKTVGTAIKALRIRTSTPDAYVDGDIWIE